MPTYDFQCGGCGHGAKDILRPLSEYGLPFPCPVCETPMRQLLSTPFIAMDYAGYSCPVTGEWVEGRRAHSENLKRQGCRVWEPGETEIVKKNREHRERELDRSLDSTVDEVLFKMGSDKVERLCNEVASGVTATVERLPLNK